MPAHRRATAQPRATFTTCTSSVKSPGVCKSPAVTRGRRTRASPPLAAKRTASPRLLSREWSSAPWFGPNGPNVPMNTSAPRWRTSAENLTSLQCQYLAREHAAVAAALTSCACSARQRVRTGTPARAGASCARRRTTPGDRAMHAARQCGVSARRRVLHAHSARASSACVHAPISCATIISRSSGCLSTASAGDSPRGGGGAAAAARASDAIVEGSARVTPQLRARVRLLRAADVAEAAAGM
jgi:hypothetical protein